MFCAIYYVIDKESWQIFFHNYFIIITRFFLYYFLLI